MPTANADFNNQLKNKDKNVAPMMRSAVLFVNFFLIITALYQLKPSSRSLILDVMSANHLPYVWIGSALVLFVAIALYNWLLRHFQRLHVVLATAVFFMTMLAVFRLLLQSPGFGVSIGFYIFVDIVGVVMVEQFWSLANSIYSTREGKHWYGLVGTGGLIGGALGSALAAALIKFTPLETPDLLLVAAGIITLIFVLTAVMGRLSIYSENPHAPPVLIRRKVKPQLREFSQSRYLLLIATALLMAQLVSPLVEFQFMKIVESSYPEREARTATLSLFFSVLSGFSIVVNLLVTPLILRYLGILGGLMVQPIVLSLATWGFTLYPGFVSAAIMKISDRGLSYSITRAAKELLYIPVDTIAMYQAKAWIDMFGYRTFKMIGAVLILFLTQWTHIAPDIINLNWVIIAGCVEWMVVLVILHRDYRAIRILRGASSVAEPGHSSSV